LTASAPGEPAPTPHSTSSGFGLFRLSIEGRRAPALFVGGWLGTIVGAGLVAIGLVATPGLATGVILLAGLATLTAGLVLLGGSQAIERQVAGEAYGGPSPVLLFVATLSATYLAAAVVGTALEAAGLGLRETDRAVGDLVIVGLQAAVAIGMIRLLVVGSGALTWGQMGFTQGARRIAEGLAFGSTFAIPLIFVTSIVGWIVVGLVGQTPVSPLPPTGTAGGLALHLVAGLAIAPLWEETLYRGAALTAWLRAGSPTGAIARSAALFVVAHVLSVGGGTFDDAGGAAVVAATVRLPIALALGWIYVRSGSIWAPIGLHAAYNGILIVLGEVSQAGV
jgi:membrane protease YdiL (CAAX protease family)